MYRRRNFRTLQTHEEKPVQVKKEVINKLNQLISKTTLAATSGFFEPK